MAILITGVAGFIGSNLAETLLSRGQIVFGVDNLCRGNVSNLSSIIDNEDFSFCEVEMTKVADYRKVLSALYRKDPITEVWHMAANSDIPSGVIDAKVDLRDTFFTTFYTLELMKEFNVNVIAFASSSAVYGDHGDDSLVEKSGPLLPISNYGAMKLASEATISAATESHFRQAFIFRFPNVIGVPATHGVILDFVRKLKATPDQLIVLGDGSQQKAYLHIDELIDAMIHIRNCAQEKVSVFNIGAGDDGVNVQFIAEETVKLVSPSARISYGEGNRGWVGDVPRFRYSIDKLRQLGWRPTLSSAEAIRKAIREIATQEHAVDIFQ